MKAWWIYFILGLAVGSVITNWHRNVDEAELKQNYSEMETSRAEEHVARLKALVVERDELRRRLDQVDSTYYGELSDAKTTVDRLTVELASAQRRLSFRTASTAPSCGVPSSSVSPGLDDGAGERRDIHPEDAAAIVRLTGEADQCRLKVTGLQERMRLLTGEKI